MELNLDIHPTIPEGTYPRLRFEYLTSCENHRDAFFKDSYVDIPLSELLLKLHCLLFELFLELFCPLLLFSLPLPHARAPVDGDDVGADLAVPQDDGQGHRHQVGRPHHVLQQQQVVGGGDPGSLAEVEGGEVGGGREQGEQVDQGKLGSPGGMGGIRPRMVWEGGYLAPATLKDGEERHQATSRRHRSTRPVSRGPSTRGRHTWY